ncbi:hypothetical protein H112_07797 [Trichophyton rubrum D6]|uniref:Uncharacterized protein n=2 Tax=Trichophyton TaxID=5550 RepID=A0A022VRR6_TRIRU|nr:hypothetical protein H100_07822 [Trichophyton rubrum MR850]EZF37954.1 hypothetical protein H102_07785 [Trichophyton rubrum CBS 100081]EZF48589.1 hypothetical protein H103_07809 [Trichophyton rubrum CBS 288.86]EZF59231.1 hypothetical protein H104_07758 [Trichophyton rubrum CBS 289.86]EZF69817.1 hypothetical protein H105_07809 [Trichophyton soudanense CBS 452.61]EZF80480.1 hypothetical protein H110_07807 [Trichophyton rubrum MR1448]EZF91152.1 hypothetical protein H113_07865 [Trichophyton rub
MGVEQANPVPDCLRSKVAANQSLHHARTSRHETAYREEDDDEIKQIEIELLYLRLGSLGRGLLWLAGWLGRVEVELSSCVAMPSPPFRGRKGRRWLFPNNVVKRSTTYHIRSRLLLHYVTRSAGWMQVTAAHPLDDGVGDGGNMISNPPPLDHQSSTINHISNLRTGAVTRLRGNFAS